MINMLKYIVGKIDHIQEQIKIIAERKNYYYYYFLKVEYMLVKKRTIKKMKVSFTELIRRTDTTEKYPVNEKIGK